MVNLQDVEFRNVEFQYPHSNFNLEDEYEYIKGYKRK